MTRDEMTRFCAAQPHASHVVQWGNADVYKIGGKVFAIVGMGETDNTVTFKTSHLAFEVLSDSPGLRPAPYMASRGLKWIQQFEEPGLSDDSLRDHIRASYDMVAAGLSKKLRVQLGFA
ncbi:putative DNA-binding protein (MmcQ/YjbR family) [Sulfitobacter undariae]|uniref:Putative DNA-binding protein (MmcQ/YjbR family) n=1 Tax=Sulfitobacter undariae TaxID=1563671 RepID=A0A7W6E201_9RHOB|nr:MmcQ/YjbR family DNA-binding protein [Sulfitobacter undariae]MBB3993261.1 putative DNA-binding protein (MmcQ/YjbR family) [Sulfitobacter undariae]